MLLDELTEDSYLVRQKEIAKVLEPHYDSVIPLFIERLKYQGEKYNEYNAIKILALAADSRGILPLIRHMEMRGGWAGNTFKLLREALKEKDNLTCKKVNDQLILYLEEGPVIPKPPDDTEDKNRIKKTIQAITEWIPHESNAEKVRLYKGMLKGLSAESPPSPVDKSKIPEYQNILVEVIDTLSEFGGLQDSRLESLLSRYIREYGFDSIAGQHALSALARINPSIAVSHLNELAVPQGNSFNRNNIRIVSTKTDYEQEPIYFDICIHTDNEPKWKEYPYLFLFENGLVFFLARGEESYQWFAGQAKNKDTAVQTAIAYLERWLPNISEMNSKTTGISRYKYLVSHRTEKYSELVEILEKYLDFDRWGFSQSYISPKYYPTIIYDSEFCRIKFSLHSGDRYGPDELSVYYGRLHAKNNDSFLTLNGEKFWCWHWDYYFLPFLDGVSPQEEAKSYAPSPILEQYRKSELAQQLSPGPAWGIGKQATIWNHYGQRLFDLFDLRKPELWERYNDFIRELYTIKGKISSIGYPPEDKIC
jgi:hypothetical protein